MFLVTGGAGFIGSNIVASLNEAGATDVAVSDWLGQGDVKWRNLAKRQIADFVPPADLARWLEGRRLDLAVTPDARTWLAERGYDPIYGARPLRRLMQTEIDDKLARALLAGEVGEPTDRQRRYLTIAARNAA